MIDDAKFSNHLVATAIEFLCVAGEELGAEFGHDRANAMMDAFDPELKAQVFMHLLMGDFMDRIRIRLTPGWQGTQKITAIKAIRAATGYGLKEAKDVTDAADAGQHVEIKGRWNAEARRKFASELYGTGYEIV